MCALPVNGRLDAKDEARLSLGLKREDEHGYVSFELDEQPSPDVKRSA